MGLGDSTGGFGNATLREYLDRINQSRIEALATPLGMKLRNNPSRRTSS